MKKQFYKISHYIDGVEDNIRTSESPKLTELEERLGAFPTPISQRVSFIVHEQIVNDRRKFISKSEELFLNQPEHIHELIAFRKQLDITLMSHERYNRMKMFAHTKQINKYVGEYLNAG